MEQPFPLILDAFHNRKLGNGCITMQQMLASVGSRSWWIGNHREPRGRTVCARVLRHYSV